MWLVVYHRHLQKYFFTEEPHINGSLVKLINLSENTPGIYLAYSFSSFSVIVIFDAIVVTLIAAAFHAQMFFNCFNSFWWMSKWYLSFVPQLNWDSALEIKIMKQWIPQNNLFQQMTMLQYWVYWLILILIQSHHTWHGYIFNIAKLYSFFLLSYLNPDVFSAMPDEHLSMEI